MKPLLVGGSIDETAGTLTAPDLDISIQWQLDEEAGVNILRKAGALAPA